MSGISIQEENQSRRKWNINREENGISKEVADIAVSFIQERFKFTQGELTRSSSMKFHETFLARARRRISECRPTRLYRAHSPFNSAWYGLWFYFLRWRLRQTTGPGVQEKLHWNVPWLIGVVWLPLRLGAAEPYFFCSLNSSLTVRREAGATVPVPWSKDKLYWVEVRHFWVVMLFSRSHCRFASLSSFASTLTYVPSHNMIHDPCSPQEASI